MCKERVFWTLQAQGAVCTSLEVWEGKLWSCLWGWVVRKSLNQSHNHQPVLGGSQQAGRYREPETEIFKLSTRGRAGSPRR